MRRLKILQIFSRYEYVGGEEGSVYRGGDALQRCHDIDYFLASSAELLEKSLTARVLLPLKIFHNPEVAWRLRRFQESGRFDLWQIHNVFPAMSPVVYRKAFSWGIPVVHFLHNYRFGCANGFFLDHGTPCQRCIQGNFWPAFFHKTWQNSHLASGAMGAVLSYARRLGVFEKIARWIAISERQKELCVQMGIPQDRIEVIPHFYEKHHAPARLPRNGYALFIGRLSPEKGVAELLEAWRLLGRKDKELVIAGQGPELPRLQAYAEKHQLSNVRFAGFLPEDAQRELWNGAAFTVVPSIWEEPFGLVVLESWAHSRPVVANRIGALPELIADGQTGFLAEPFQPESLVQAIQRAFGDPDLCQSMGNKGRLIIRAKFTRREWLEKMNDTYRRLGF